MSSAAERTRLGILQTIATEIGAQPRQVEAAVGLLDEGATVPFIARYRKEVTGSLDDTRPRVAEDFAGYFEQPRMVSTSEVPALLAALAAESLRPDGSAVSLWWTASEDGRSALVRACHGLPSAEQYIEMLGTPS